MVKVFGQQNWKNDVTIYRDSKDCRRDRFEDEDQEFVLGHFKFDMPTRGPGGIIKKADRYMVLGFRAKVWGYLGLIYLYLLFKRMNLSGQIV